MEFLQNILVYILVIAAVGWLVKKYFWKKKAKNSCGKDDCGCS